MSWVSALGSCALRSGRSAWSESERVSQTTPAKATIQRPAHRRSSESYDSIDSWDAVKCGPYEKKYFMQRRAGREATMEAGGEAFNIGEGGSGQR